MSMLYNRGKYLIATTNLAAADVRCLLTTAAYAANADHNSVADVTDELSGTGYVRKALASLTVTEDDTNDWVVFDAADVTWTAINAGIAARAVLYVEGASDAARQLLGVVDLAAPITTNGGDLTLVWSASGIVRLA